MTNLTCDRCAERLGDYLEGMLSPSEAAALTTHLESCARCREGLARYKAIPGMVRSATDVRMPAGVRARLRWILNHRKGR